MAGVGLRELEALRLVAERNGFRAAAAELNLSPSAVSQMIASLERQLGVRLLNRSTRSVALTEAGAAFLDHVRPAVGMIRDAMKLAGGFGEQPQGRIRINASEGAAERVLPSLLRFLLLYPEVRIDLVTDGRLVDIVDKGFDAGIRLAEAVPQDMVAVSLGLDESFIIVASPAYLARAATPASPGDLQRHECIRALLPSGRPFEWELEHDGRAFTVETSGRLTVGSSALARQAAIAGAGIAYVDAWGARLDILDGRLVQLLSDWTPPYPGNCLYYPRNRLPTAAFRALVAHLREERTASLPE